MSVDASSACLSTEVLARFLESGEGAWMSPEVAHHVDVCAMCRNLVARMALARTPDASAREGEPVPPLPRGAQVGRYVVLSVAGAGAMGVVYAAYDEELDRKVAIKLLHATGAEGSPSARALREAQAMARVTHANVVTIYEVGEHRGHIFIAMEFVEGTTLRRFQIDPLRTWEELIQVYVGAGDGLLAAHRAGLVHRDFKPDNVLIGADGRARVADFGLARIEELGPIDDAPRGPIHALRSVSGTILGTPAYMSPEQLRGETADARSDQFSFCVALYEALYETPPFVGADVSALALAISTEEVRPAPPSSRVPPPIFATLQRGLRRDPALRFPSMNELLEKLARDPRLDPSAPSMATRLRLLASLSLILVGTTLLAHLLGRAQSLEVARLFQLGLMQTAILVCLAMVLRPRLAWNVVHWGLMRLAILTAVHMALLRWVAMQVDLELRWVFALDHLAFATGLAVAALAYVPRFWMGAALSVSTAIGLSVTPRFPLQAAEIAYPLATLLAFGAWYQATRVGRAPTPRWSRAHGSAPSPQSAPSPR